MSEDNSQFRRIPDNAVKQGKFLNFSWLHWAEAILFTAGIAVLIWISPFVPRIKLICIVVVGAAIFALCMHGIKNRCITEIIVDIINDNRIRKKYHLGSVKDERKQNTTETVYGNESLLEKSIRIVKKSFREFDEKYGS